MFGRFVMILAPLSWAAAGRSMRFAVDEASVAIRFPVETDCHVRFEAGGGLAGRISWHALLEGHDPPVGRFAFVAEIYREVVGITTVLAGPLELELEFLARNAATSVGAGFPVGSVLLERVLEFALGLRLPWIKVESLDEPALLAFYERNGYVRDGPPLFDAIWGVLHPMRRPTAHWRS